jgi:hypothetical protein
VKDEAEAERGNRAVFEGFNVEFVAVLLNYPVMHVFSIQELIKPGWTLHVTVLGDSFYFLKQNPWVSYVLNQVVTGYKIKRLIFEGQRVTAA